MLRRGGRLVYFIPFRADDFLRDFPGAMPRAMIVRPFRVPALVGFRASDHGQWANDDIIDRIDRVDRLPVKYFKASCVHNNQNTALILLSSL